MIERAADIFAYLQPYNMALGGTEGILSVDGPTLATFITHPGGKYVLHQDFYKLALRDVRGGYAVYDRNFVLMYVVAMSLDPVYTSVYATDGLNAVIPEFVFGEDVADTVFMLAKNPGDFFYIAYTKQIRLPKGVIVEERICDLVLVSPISVVLALTR